MKCNKGKSSKGSLLQKIVFEAGPFILVQEGTRGKGLGGAVRNNF